MFELILTLFADQYDIVIMDTPASAEVADAQILASHAGAAVILARRNHTRRAQLVATMLNFAQTQVNVIGSVINDH